jgi:FKBP-type peptidyl-prolyl cis-trans isomerase
VSKSFFSYLLGLFLLLTLTSCFLGDDCGQSANTNVNKTQLQEDIDAIDAYLSENNIEAEIHKSGIRYVINTKGDGSKPSLCDQVTVNYEGRLMSNGRVFDDAGGRNIAFPLANLITGWKIGIPLIKEGGSITLYIPSVYAYGSRGSQDIPSNSNLVFDISLIQVF